MPTYQNVTPPISLFSGDVGFSFNNETFPAANTAGSQFALPSFTGLPDSGTAVRWQTIFGTAPTAVNMVLQAAMADVDADRHHDGNHGRSAQRRERASKIPAHQVCLFHWRGRLDCKADGLKRRFSSPQNTFRSVCGG